MKKRYGMFVAALESCSTDNLPFLKERAIKTMYELLVRQGGGGPSVRAAGAGGGGGMYVCVSCR